MESEEDPLKVKFILSSLEFEKLKYYEKKYRELTLLVDKLKLENSQFQQVGSGNFVIEPNALDQLETPVLQEYPNSDQPLINYSVSMIKNDDNDNYDESALLHLIPEKDKFNAKCLLSKLETRGSELTWNSSGVVFIDNISIPNSNVFMIYPHLFQKSLPKSQIPGLKEVIKKLEDMGLKKFILVSDVCKDKELAESVGAAVGAGQTIEEKSDIEVLPQTDVEDEWYYLGL
jgi:hypothetical protein